MRTPSRTLLFYLALSDALLALGNLLGVMWYLYSDSKTIHKSHGYCAFQSAMTIYFSCTSFFWTVTMALSLFNAVVMKNASFAATHMKIFHLLAWIPPGIIVVVALSMDVLGTDTSLEQASWCWIDPRTPHVLVWQFASGKFWEILSYITVVVLYTTIKVFLKKQELKKKTMVGTGSVKRSRKDVIAEANRKLTFVPFVFIVCRIWGTLRFLLGNFAVEHINEPYVTWINPLQGIGDSAQGFANCVLYCLSTEKIRHRLARTICPRRFVPILVSETVTESNVKYSKKTRVGVADDASRTYTDIKKFESEQSVSIIETHLDQSSHGPTNGSGSRVTFMDINKELAAEKNDLQNGNFGSKKDLQITSKGTEEINSSTSTVVESLSQSPKIRDETGVQKRQSQGTVETNAKQLKDATTEGLVTTVVNAHTVELKRIEYDDPVQRERTNVEQGMNVGISSNDKVINMFCVTNEQMSNEVDTYRDRDNVGAHETQISSMFDIVR